MSLSGPFLFDPRAFWGDEDVKLLSWSQIGVYMALLSHQWEEGDIPEDRRRARAAIAGGEREKVPDADLDAVFPFFGPVPGEPGRLRNERLHEEREAWKAKKAKRSAAGKASGAARRRASAEQAGALAEQEPNMCSTDVEHMPNRSSSSSSSSSVSGSEKRRARKRAADEDVGSSLPPEVEALGDLLTADERGALGSILTDGSADPKGVKSPKETDEPRMRQERLHLLAALAVSFADLAKGADHPLELWAAWRKAARKKAKKPGATNWRSDVLTLRSLLFGPGKTARQRYDAFLQASRRGWQGFDWDHVGGNGGKLKPLIDGPTATESAAAMRRRFEEDKARRANR